MSAEAPCRLLEWDTEFFGRRIASLAGGRLDAELWARAERWCRDERVECLYFLAESGDPATIRAAEDAGLRLTDVRVTLECGLRAPPPAELAGLRVAREDDLDRLREIARASHTVSRFWSDPGFPREDCARLYATWIERSVRGSAERVWVVDVDGRAAGYLSCHLHEGGVGQMGLLAVAADAQGRGLGKALVRRALAWFAEERCSAVRVVTQGTNVGATALYESAGFRTRTLELWYHHWFAQREQGRR